MKKFLLVLAAGVAIGVAADSVKSLSPISSAHAQQAGCQYLTYQSIRQAEAEIGQRYAAGATVVSFYEDKSTMRPFTAFVCQR